MTNSTRLHKAKDTSRRPAYLLIALIYGAALIADLYLRWAP